MSDKIKFSFYVLSEPQPMSRRDVEDIDRLIKQLSPDAPAMTEDRMMAVCYHGALALAVAEIEGQTRLIGCATITKMESLTHRRGHVDDVVVDHEFRRMGVAHGLMAKVTEYARDQRLECLDLTSGPSREAANALYKKLGFEQRNTNSYHKTLG